jgi:hypothetical protein
MKAVQEEHATDLVVKISRMDLNLEKVSFRIDERLPLAAFELLAAILAARPAGRCRLDRLAVEDGGRGERTSAALGPIALAQDLVDAFPLPGPAPCAEVVIHHAPRRQVMRHHAPRDGAPQHIEAAVKDTAKLIAPVRTSVLTRHKHARDKLPLFVRQIS